MITCSTKGFTVLNTHILSENGWKRRNIRSSKCLEFTHLLISVIPLSFDQRCGMWSLQIYRILIADEFAIVDLAFAYQFENKQRINPEYI